MKKIVAVIMTALCLLSLVACGKNEYSVVGTWSGEYIFPDANWTIQTGQGKEFEPNDLCVMKLELFDGNTIKITRTDSITGAEYIETGSWEQNDNVIIIEVDNGTKVGYVIDEANNTLTLQQSGIATFANELAKE